LRQHASRYLDKVKAGEVIEVTERGELIALLVPPSPARTVRDRLVSSGVLLPAKSLFEIPRHRHLNEGTPTASMVLADQRQEKSL
jgi:prevent-host-death family protein